MYRLFYFFLFSDSHFDVVMKTTKIFQLLPLGKLLSSIEGTNIHQVLKSYIVDFVHMIHPVQSDAECDVSNTINPVIG